MGRQWTVVDLIRTTASFFERKGIAGSARLDAELLLARVLGCRRIDLYVRFDAVVVEPQLAEFRELVRQRGERRPVKQLLGCCEFMSHEFEVTPDVLIPRPETEAVVEHAIAALGDGAGTAADIGTGCGNIAISIALARPGVTVYAIDLSEAALAVAARNASRHSVQDRVQFLAGDLLAPLARRELDGALDVIVSNPPYIGEAEFPGLMPEVAQHEPRDALLSDQDGAGHTLRILSDAPRFLRSGGTLVIETSPVIAPRVLAAAGANDAFSDVRIERDLNKAERVLIARRRG